MQAQAATTPTTARATTTAKSPKATLSNGGGGDAGGCEGGCDGGGDEGDVTVIVTTGGVTLSTRLLSGTPPTKIGEDGRDAMEVTALGLGALRVTTTAYTCGIALAFVWSLLPTVVVTWTTQPGE